MRQPQEIEALVRHAWTGNHTHDLMMFSLEEMDIADRCWRCEASRRYEQREIRRRAQNRWFLP